MPFSRLWLVHHRPILHSSLKTHPGLARKKQQGSLFCQPKQRTIIGKPLKITRTITIHLHCLISQQNVSFHDPFFRTTTFRICWRRKVAEINPPASLENQSLLGNPVAIHSWVSRIRTRGEQLRLHKKKCVSMTIYGSCFFH